MSERPFNVLCIPSWYPESYDPTNGIFIQKHIEAAALHCNVVVLYVAPDSELKDLTYAKRKYTSKGIQVVESRYRYDDLNETVGGAFKRFIRFIKAARKGLKESDKIMANPDLVHVHITHPAGRMALYLHYLRKLPFIISEQWTGYTDYNNSFYQQNKLTRYLSKRAFRKARAVSTVSAFLSTGMENKGLIQQPAKVIPNVVSLPNNPQFQEKPEKPVIAYTISDLRDDAKNISGLLHSVKKVVEDFPDFQLHHIGIGPDKDLLHGLAEELGLMNKHVFFHGYVPNDELFELLQKGHFFTLNSSYETFSVATAEAIGYGLPVVITKSGAPEEFVNEDVGILVERENVESMAEGIRIMIKRWKEYNPHELHRYIKERFSKDRIGKEFASWYEQVLASH